MKTRKIQVKGEWWEASHDLEQKRPFCLRLGTDRSPEGNCVVALSPGVRIGQLSENAAIPVKCATHINMDSSKTSVETLSVIPFGAEPRISRSFDYMPHVMSVATNLCLPGKIETTSVEIDSMEISADLIRFAILKMNPQSTPQNKLEWMDITQGSTIYDSGRVFHSILLEDSSSNRIEISSGFDIWRWHKASPPLSSKFTIEPSKNGARIKRLVVSSTEPATIPHSALQLSWHLSWVNLDKAASTKAPSTDITPDFSGDKCLRSRPNRTAMRNLIRSLLPQAQKGQIFSIDGLVPTSCDKPYHTGKTNMEECEHWDISEIFNFWFWGNHQLSPKGAKLLISAPEKSPFSQFPSFMIMKNGHPSNKNFCSED